MTDVIDLDLLSKSFMNKPDIVCSVLKIFVDGFANFAANYQQAMSQGDAREMFRLAHSLKGSAANIRANGLSGEASSLQNMLRSWMDDAANNEVTGKSLLVDNKNLQAQYAKVIDELDSVFRFIDKYSNDEYTNTSS